MTRSSRAFRVQGFRRGLNLVIIGPLLLLAISTALNVLQIARLIRCVHAVDAADLTISAAREVQGLALDMETAVRGFELTRDPEFLQPYRTAEVALPAALERLDRLREPAERASTDAVRASLAAWKREADAALADGPAGFQMQAALHAKALMDRVRERIDAVVKIESAERAKFAPELHRKIRFAVGEALAVVLAFGLAMGLLARRQFAVLSRGYEAALDESAAREAAQRRVNDALIASETSLRTLIDALPDPVVVHRHGDIVFINSAATRCLGQSFGELEGASIFTLLVPEEREVVRARIERLDRQAGSNPPQEQHLLRSDGTVMHAEVTGTQVVFQGAPATVARIHDLTERDGMTAQLSQVDRMVAIGTLAAGVGHEINNPLAYVMSNLEFALSELPASAATEEVLSALQEAHGGAARIRDIVRDLKGFSRVDEEVGPVDVNRAIELSLNLGAAELGRRARVIRELEPLPMIAGNERKLSQVIVNLLINAGHACLPELARAHEVRVRSRVAGERVEIAVEDTGTGIPPEALPRIFEPFFTTKPVGQGTGLGLPICRNIVAEMGGELRVSTRPGEGTTFTVSLPLPPADAGLAAGPNIPMFRDAA